MVVVPFSCQVAPFLFGFLAAGSLKLDVHVTAKISCQLLFFALAVLLLARTLRGHYTYGVGAVLPGCCSFSVWLFGCCSLTLDVHVTLRHVVSCQVAPFLFGFFAGGSLTLHSRYGKDVLPVALFRVGCFAAGSNVEGPLYLRRVCCLARLLLSCLALLLVAPLR